MFLSHFSVNPIKELKTYTQNEGDRRSFVDKPRGLWVSVDNEPNNWEDWCKSENFQDHDEMFRYGIYLNPEPNILLLDSDDSILDFTRRYGIKTDFRDDAINWMAVSKEFAGIIITPYSWNLRLDRRVFWYYGWDCASGCIWDKDAIQRIDLVRAPVKDMEWKLIEDKKVGELA